MIATSDWLQPAPLSSEPPSASAAAAISGPVWRRVPWVSRPAVIEARPESCGGSSSLPESTTSIAVTSGTPSRGATMTRRPFGRAFSTGAAIASGRGAAGGGGVSNGCADAAAASSSGRAKASQR